MRMRLPLGRTLLFAVALLFALVALLPLRLALDWFGFGERGLAARAATGSVWRGALQEAQLGPLPLGDVSTRLDLLPLFFGRARLALRAAEPGGFAGALTASRHGFGVDDVSGGLRAGALFAPLPVVSLDFEDFSAGFAAGRCVRAEGAIRATVGGPVAGLGLGAGLGGRARCAGDALLLSLAGRSGAEQLNIRLFADGRYRVELLVRPRDPLTAARLAAAGLRPLGGAYGLRVDGSF